ncbi:chemotaxis response regulator protein-glutamate methylesterase [Desulfonema ishimotonii]|uniref:Protein-glutamate methylesterase/protein-glutamine glutaminase n=1 Tax=Desulfonema ishimotonii TaxID=45657 RepID=A0A401FT28_9BACT|nr:chemotaxis-specific protein-glutamate methyltransferase CheB [Desulfonema ishimotonii]GBC60121.1 chemotaxis response regulator protein-glutamate methylesterase [Desulfonema ishimotonii]
MAPIKVLVVDDSMMARELIADLLADDREVRVIGQAGNGRDALAFIARQRPDIVIMDIEMPVMNGIEAIERIMKENALPILVVTARDDAETAFTAISGGALEVLPKPDIDMTRAAEFVRKVKLLSRIRVIRHIRGGTGVPRCPLPAQNRAEVIAIAASTGGPGALCTILSRLPADFPVPIVVSQHISDNFEQGMARWLNDACRLRVKAARASEQLCCGTVYISPSETHMAISHARKIIFHPRQPGDIYFPSCDILLSSVADICGSGSVGIILTGMGNDGVRGICRVREQGGLTIAQDEASSVVFGMPRAAVETGCVSRILPLGDIGPQLTALVRKQS